MMSEKRLNREHIPARGVVDIRLCANKTDCSIAVFQLPTFLSKKVVLFILRIPFNH